MTRQKILLVQRNSLGKVKADAVGSEKDRISIEVLDIYGEFPELVDEPEQAFPGDFEDYVGNFDLVLDFLGHPDLSEHLAALCNARSIPVIASGRKIAGAVCPTTCCTLARDPGLGAYGELFGAPELEVMLDDSGRISNVKAVRRASCRATELAAEKLIGMTREEALEKYGLFVQFFCKGKATPGLFHKNPIHVAADIHTLALKRALDRSGE